MKYSIFILLAFVVLATGCSTPRGGGIGPGYFWQAALGQLQISNRARPITTVLREGRIDRPTRQALEAVDSIKDFGEEQGLRATRNFEEYVDLKRPAVVWVATACEPLRFEVQRWGFPVVGSFSYLGWFDRGDGERFRRRLEEAGYDADLRPARAYSTLGWFRDPLLSTMVPTLDGLGDLVEVVLHESVHSTLHIKGQSTLNESLAQFLGEKLAIRYLESRGDAGAKPLASYRRRLEDERQRQRLLHAGYVELQAIYESNRSDSQKLQEKQAVLSRLRKALSWPDARTLNNATLAGFATYHSAQAGWERLWHDCGGSVRNLLRAVKGFSDGDERARSGPELQSVDLDNALSRMRTVCRSLESASGR